MPNHLQTASASDKSNYSGQRSDQVGQNNDTPWKTHQQKVWLLYKEHFHLLLICLYHKLAVTHQHQIQTLIKSKQGKTKIIEGENESISHKIYKLRTCITLGLIILLVPNKKLSVNHSISKPMNYRFIRRSQSVKISYKWNKSIVRLTKYRRWESFIQGQKAFFFPYSSEGMCYPMVFG